MAVLHVSTSVPDGIDPSTTVLARSLRDQDRATWRLLTAADRGDFGPDDGITFVDHCVALDPRAVGTLLDALASRPDAAAVYGDGRRVSGADEELDLRPAWSPDLLRTRRYTGDPFVVRAGVLFEISSTPDWTPRGRHGLALELAARDAIVLHVPAVLATGPATADDTHDTVAAVETHLRRTARPASAHPGIRPGTVRLVPSFDARPTVSLIIPTAGTSRTVDGESTRLIERCLDSLAPLVWPDLRVIIVVGDEYDGDPEELLGRSRHPTDIVRRPAGPFSFPDAINTGVLATDSELVVLLNDDTEALDGAWLAALAMHALDDGVGAVGAALLYPDESVQHAGIAIVEGRPLHSFVGRALDRAGAGEWPAETRNVLAVTAACMMLRRSVMLAIGAMSPGFPLSFNDTDLCLRLVRCGKRVVFEPSARLVHHESASRRPTIETWEWERFLERWGELIDPYYHPGYTRPDDPLDIRRNADHLLPTTSPFDPQPRAPVVRPRVHWPEEPATPDDRAGSPPS